MLDKFKFSLHFTHENKFCERLKSWLKPIQVKTRRNWNGEIEKEKLKISQVWDLYLTSKMKKP